MWCVVFLSVSRDSIICIRRTKEQHDTTGDCKQGKRAGQASWTWSTFGSIAQPQEGHSRRHAIRSHAHRTRSTVGQVGVGIALAGHGGLARWGHGVRTGGARICTEHRPCDSWGRRNDANCSIVKPTKKRHRPTSGGAAGGHHGLGLLQTLVGQVGLACCHTLAAAVVGLTHRAEGCLALALLAHLVQRRATCRAGVAGGTGRAHCTTNQVDVSNISTVPTCGRKNTQKPPPESDIPAAGGVTDSAAGAVGAAVGGAAGAAALHSPMKAMAGWMQSGVMPSAHGAQ